MMSQEKDSDTKKPPLGGYDITAYCLFLFVLIGSSKMVPGVGLEPTQP